MDLSVFDFSQVEDMGIMFMDCNNMEEIKFGNISTSNLKAMDALFQGCKKLSSIDLSKFDTSKVTTMQSLFNGCQNLKDINFGNMDTSNLQNMQDFFKDCIKLESIDLSSFDTSKVTTMEGMFYSCSNFRFLNLSSLKTNNIVSVKSMFDGASSLIYLNLYSMVLDSGADWTNIFSRLSENVIYCIHDTNTQEYILPPNSFCFCSDECFIINWTKIDFYNERCLDTCQKSNNNKLEYKNVCYNKCPEGTILNDFICEDNFCAEQIGENENCKYGKPLGYYLDTDDNYYKQCFENCKTCYGEGDEGNNNCIDCKTGFRFLNDDVNGKNCYKDCQYNYYFDGTNNYHCTDDDNCPSDYDILITEKKKCIEQCEKDNIYQYEFHHHCYDHEILETTLLEETTFVEEKKETTYIEKEKQTTYVEENKETTYIEEKNKTTNLEVKKEFSHIENVKMATYIEIEVKTIKATYSDDEIYECFNENYLINKCIIKNNFNNNEIYDFITTNILSGLSSNNFKGLVIEGEGNVIYQVTNGRNEKNLLNGDDIPEDYNYTIIDLGECEALLKEHYHIREEDSLIIVKKETLSNVQSQKKFEYSVFEPYNNTELNLSICSEVDINVYVKLDLSDETKQLAQEMEELGFNIFDINDPFHQDICTPYTPSSSKSDMLLSDRIDSIYNNKDARCQGNCEFSNYMLGSRFINCTCHHKQEANDTLEIKKIDKYDAKSLLQSFYYVLKYSNYKILKCYKLVFVKSVFIKNKGAIIIFILFILYLICLIWYIFQGLKPLKDTLVYVIIEEDGKLTKRKNNLYFPPKQRKSSVKYRDSNKTLTKYQKEKKAKFNIEPKKVNSKSPFHPKNSEKERQVHYNSMKEVFNSRLNSNKPKKSKKSQVLIEYKESINDLQTEEVSRKYDDFELNDMPYEEAVKYDHRSCFWVYLSLIKREHRIIFTFLVCRDYNLIPVKLSRFIFLLSTDMTMNVFFFSDSSMHKIFLNYGKYNFIQQIPQVIYSTIVSQIIEVFLCYLSLTDKHIYEIKNLKYNSKNKREIIDAFKCMKKKLFYYFLITFIFFLGYWYIVAVFCAVYTNTQIIFIKDSLISSLMGFVYPMILYLFPANFRVCALKCKNNNCLYKFSDFIPFF